MKRGISCQVIADARPRFFSCPTSLPFFFFFHYRQVCDRYMRFIQLDTKRDETIPGAAPVILYLRNRAATENNSRWCKANASVPNKAVQSRELHDSRKSSPPGVTLVDENGMYQFATVSSRKAKIPSLRRKTLMSRQHTTTVNRDVVLDTFVLTLHGAIYIFGSVS